MKAAADELIRLEVAEYIANSTLYNVMKKLRSSRGYKGIVHPQSRCEICGRNGGRTEGISMPNDPLRPVVCIDGNKQAAYKSGTSPLRAVGTLKNWTLL